ncbi:hypothetical protein IG197_31930 (plasmid) [Aminobacter sp. SR38]|jgi:hypothetical protein|uniref:hypothetical protein n=1 Tax=Aminobacter sp. SR38 TaxID=2774562 RepID=UPI001782F7B9|nr:hypothetical protein [Aminobacter sp. SR38]QOF75197.1 hypothetical protein IG197_31930 [Aminobacter sp. SR38]
MSTHNIRLDLDEFKPEAKKADPAAKASVEKIAVESGFNTRHAPESPKREPVKAVQPAITAPIPPSAPEGEGEARRRGRKRTTNRNTPFAVKLKVETNNQIYEFADRLECNAIAEVLELALGALQKEIDEGIDPRTRAAEQAAAKG